MCVCNGMGVCRWVAVHLVKSRSVRRGVVEHSRMQARWKTHVHGYCVLAQAAQHKGRNAIHPTRSSLLALSQARALPSTIHSPLPSWVKQVPL